jgi:hypothetical protein
MFDNIQLFTKTDNKVQEPNNSWTANTTIHCSFDLNLGFGTEKEIWDTGNSVKLKQLINFFVDLNSFVTNSQKNELLFNLKNNDLTYSVIWIKSENQAISAKVTRQYYNSTKFILQKAFVPMEIIDFSRQFFITVISKLAKDTNNEVTSTIGELFYRRQGYKNFEFKIGQKVKTKIGQNVKTERQGIVAYKWYHDKDKTTMYQFLVDNKILDKRYLPMDLKLIE